MGYDLLACIIGQYVVDSICSRFAKIFVQLLRSRTVGEAQYAPPNVWLLHQFDHLFPIQEIFKTFLDDTAAYCEINDHVTIGRRRQFK